MNKMNAMQTTHKQICRSSRNTIGLRSMIHSSRNGGYLSLRVGYFPGCEECLVFTMNILLDHVVRIYYI
jgi:hypothetical protein